MWVVVVHTVPFYELMCPAEEYSATQHHLKTHTVWIVMKQHPLNVAYSSCPHFCFLFAIRSLLTTTSWSSATEDANVWKSALACIYTPKDNRRWKCIRIFGVVVVVVGMCGRCAKTRPCHYFTFQRGDTRNLGAAPTTTKDFKFVTRCDNRKLCAVDDKIIKLIIYELVVYNCKCVNMCLTSLNSVMSDVPGITTSINTQLLLPI